MSQWVTQGNTVTVWHEPVSMARLAGKLKLDNKPAFGTWNLQLLADDGQPLSPVIEIEMKGDPRANLAYVIFYQNH